MNSSAQKSPPCSIHVALHEHETGTDDFSSWPQVVQNIHTEQLDRWAHRNADLDIIGQTHSIDPARKVTVTEWHYAPRASDQKVQP